MQFLSKELSSLWFHLQTNNSPGVQSNKIGPSPPPQPDPPSPPIPPLSSMQIRATR